MRCATLLGGQFVQHRQVVEPLPQLLDAAQLALGVGQLAGDLLGARLVVPQLRIGRRVLQLLDAVAQTVDIEHPLHRRQSGVECGDVVLPVGIHGSSGYRPLRGSSIGLVTSPVTTRQPLARRRAATASLLEGLSMRPYHVAIVGSGPSGYFAAASLLKFADSTDGPTSRGTCASTCWRCCRRRGVWCVPASRPTTRRSRRSAPSSRRSATRPALPLLRQHPGRRARAGRRTRRALRRRRSTPSARSRTARWASPARSCQAASPPSTSSAGTTPTRTSRR